MAAAPWAVAAHDKWVGPGNFPRALDCLIAAGRGTHVLGRRGRKDPEGCWVAAEHDTLVARRKGLGSTEVAAKPDTPVGLVPESFQTAAKSHK